MREETHEILNQQNADQTLKVTKEQILDVRSCSVHAPDFFHLTDNPQGRHHPIEDQQRSMLWKLFDHHKREKRYLFLEGIHNGYDRGSITYYDTDIDVCKSFGGHGLKPGDICRYEGSYAGLQGMILGVTENSNSRHPCMAILNINYQNQQYVLEHYSDKNIVNSNGGDRRRLEYEFPLFGLQCPSIRDYHDSVLLPLLKDCLLDFSSPVISLLAKLTAEMMTHNDVPSRPKVTQ